MVLSKYSFIVKLNHIMYFTLGSYVYLVLPYPINNQNIVGATYVILAKKILMKHAYNNY